MPKPKGPKLVVRGRGGGEKEAVPVSDWNGTHAVTFHRKSLELRFSLSVENCKLVPLRGLGMRNGTVGDTIAPKGTASNSYAFNGAHSPFGIYDDGYSGGYLITDPVIR